MLNMRMQRPRRGTIIPMMALTITALFAFVALAIDLGMLTVARTESQNAADVAALVGTRTLDNKPNASSTYRNNALAAGKAAMTVLSGNSAAAGDASSNRILGGTIPPNRVTSIRFGVYSYVPLIPASDGGRFDLTSYSTNVANGSYNPSLPAAAPGNQSWAAMEVIVNGDQPTFFAKVIGIGSMATSARALAIHRPRDVAIVLDFSGSMAFGSEFTFPDYNEDNTARGVNNPDSRIPRFGHYQRYDNYRTIAPNRSDYNNATPSNRSHPLMMRQAYVQSSGEVFASANFTVETPSGPPIVKDFLTGDSSNPTGNAFHHWEPPQLSGLSVTRPDPNNPPIVTAATYSDAGYDAVYNRTSVTMPAPPSFGTQLTNSPNLGDKHPRKRGATVGTTWDPTNANGSAITLAEYLGWSEKYTSGNSLPAIYTGRNSAPLSLDSTYSPTNAYQDNASDFRDATWERYGYDLDVKNYVDNRDTPGLTWDPRYDWDIDLNRLTTPYVQTGAIATPSEISDYYPFSGSQAALYSTLIPFKPRRKEDTDQLFKGYTMGPGYWGKTFFIWPPDPRFDPNANLNSPDPERPGFDTGDKPMCDWRRHFFFNNSGSSVRFDPQTDSISGGDFNGINAALMEDGNTKVTLEFVGTNAANVEWKINYDAVLAWLKAGPKVFPDNLRAGRCLYYSEIPTTIPQSGSMTNDQRFWREYIDYVIGYQANGNNYDPRRQLAGFDEPSWPDGLSSNSCFGGTMNQYSFNDSTGTPRTDPYPYMHYNDNPIRPRMHMWFGPQTMMSFLMCRSPGWNMNAGTLHEAQTWQLKAGIQSGLDDIRNNHPNDWVGMTFFAKSFNDRRVPMGQRWDPLKNTLFFPYDRINGTTGALTGEWRPYNNGFTAHNRTNLPNARGGTDPGTGLANAYNLLSSSSTLNPDGTGRRGAAKIVIFETDGVPNALTEATFVTNGPQSYYQSTSPGASQGNGNPGVISQALSIVDQIVKPVNSTNGTDSGHSLPNAPARVYAIAFGDLFDAPNAQQRQPALNFLRDVAIRGNTLESGAASLPTNHIITGDYNQRIDRLRVTIERIMQSGVQVTLIE